MYLEWVKWVVLIGAVVGIAWAAYMYFYAEPIDGQPCERDVDCDDGVCISDQGTQYCTRTCTDDEACLPGWRCLRPVTRNGLFCIQPAL